MKDDQSPPGEEFKKLGRGILRTFIRDVAALGLGALMGAGVGLLLGEQFGFSIRIGAIVGAFIGLAARSHLSPLFDYDRAPMDQDKSQ